MVHPEAERGLVEAAGEEGFRNMVPQTFNILPHVPSIRD
jgi:hypothetical protein